MPDRRDFEMQRDHAGAAGEVRPPGAPLHLLPHRASFPRRASTTTAYRRAPRRRLRASRDTEPLSMYVHIPFCEARCTYCGCSVVISPRRGPEEGYLADARGRAPACSARSLGDRRSAQPAPLGWRDADLPVAEQCRTPLSRTSSTGFSLTPGAEVATRDRPVRDAPRAPRQSCAASGSTGSRWVSRTSTPRSRSAVARPSADRALPGAASGRRGGSVSSVNST